MPIRFIHAADLHIDSPMKGLGDKDPKVAQKVRTATRSAFVRLVDFAIDEKVSFVVIAGDIFDGNWDDVETGIWTGGQFHRLKDANIPVFITYGNHDGKNKILRNMKNDVFPSNVHIFSRTAPERVIFEDNESGERVAITGQSYSDWECPDNLAANYPEPEPGVFNIAVLHTGLGGGSAHAYSPTTVVELKNLGYDYWALGHQHRREVLLDSNDSFIAYSGVIQARHINESANQGNGFFLVEVENGRRVGAPAFCPVDSFSWLRINIDLSEFDADEPDDAESELIEELKTRLEDALSRDDVDGIAARVYLTGRSCLFGRFAGVMDDSENPTRMRIRQGLSSGIMNGRVWLERLDVSGVQAPIPDDFWGKGALKEIHDGILEQNAKLTDGTDAKAQKGAKAQKALLPALEPLVSKINPFKSDLLYGKRSDSSATPEPDPDGIALDDPEQYKKWNLAALDVLADVLMNAEEEGQN